MKTPESQELKAKAAQAAALLNEVADLIAVVSQITPGTMAESDFDPDDMEAIENTAANLEVLAERL